MVRSKRPTTLHSMRLRKYSTRTAASQKHWSWLRHSHTRQTLQRLKHWRSLSSIGPEQGPETEHRRTPCCVWPWRIAGGSSIKTGKSCELCPWTSTAFFHGPIGKLCSNITAHHQCFRRVESTFAFLKATARYYMTMKGNNVANLARARQNHVDIWLRHNRDAIHSGSVKLSYERQIQRYQEAFTLNDAMTAFEAESRQ